MRQEPGIHLGVRPTGSNFQNFFLERGFRSRTWRQSSRRNFYSHLGHRTAKNYGSVFLTKGRPNGSSFQIFPLGSISLQNLTPVVPIVSIQDFLHILATPQPKISIWSFWPACYQNPLGSILRCDQMGQISKFFPWREYFIPELDPGGTESIFILILAALQPKITAQSFWPTGDQMGQIFIFFAWREYFTTELHTCGHKSFFPGFVNHFGRPMDKNFDSVFLTGVRPEPGIVIFRCVQLGQISKFLPWREYFAPEFDASGPESFSSGFFYQLGRHTTEKFHSIFLMVCDQNLLSILRCAKWVKFPKFSPGESISLRN